MNKITSGRIKKKNEKKCVYNPTGLEAALQGTRGDISQKAATKK
jgi:hypothetical protein